MLLSLALYRFLREPPRGWADANQFELAAHGVRSTTPLSARETVLAISRSPVALLLMAVFMGINSVATVFLTWTPTYLVEKFHFGLSSAGLSGSVFINLASALSVPLAGLLADRLAGRFAGGRIAVQAIGLLVGSVFVFLVGVTPTVSTLLVAMACFGFCKGFYDSNIFASLYDCIEPRARASAAGVMNCIGWGGGALGPLVVGLIAKYGRHSNEMDNMSEAIASCGLIYLVGAVALAVAIVLSQRQHNRT
jgi:MFS family permease